MACPLHVALFPFMAKGHTIPLLQLVKLIHNHHLEAKFTIFTTPANEPFIVSYLSSLPSDLLNIVSFSFPFNSEFSKGVESTDQLPSMSQLFPFLHLVEKFQPQFEIALKSIQDQDFKITCLVSDGFLYWTQESASKFNIPRLGFYGMNNYSYVTYSIVAQTRPFLQIESRDELITVASDLPWVQLSRNDFDWPWSEQNPQGPPVEYMIKCGNAMQNSYGLLVNSFYEIESQYLDYCNLKFKPKAWCIGPLCLAESPQLESLHKPNYADWLDKKWGEGRPILYVAFGTQAEISSEQLKEIMIGLEKSRVDFLWALKLRPNKEEVINGLEERVEGRGLIVREWVEQRKILGHEGVKGFLTHCGWNSITESVCASVPMLAMPMMAEQHLNARMIVDDMKVGLRVNTCDGSVKGLVKWDDLSEVMLELMVGEKGRIVSKNVEEVAKLAKNVIRQGGSSWNSLESLLDELHNLYLQMSK